MAVGQSKAPTNRIAWKVRGIMGGDDGTGFSEVRDDLVRQLVRQNGSSGPAVSGSVIQPRTEAKILSPKPRAAPPKAPGR